MTALTRRRIEAPQCMNGSSPVSMRPVYPVLLLVVPLLLLTVSHIVFLEDNKVIGLSWAKMLENTITKHPFLGTHYPPTQYLPCCWNSVVNSLILVLLLSAALHFTIILLLRLRFLLLLLATFPLPLTFIYLRSILSITNLNHKLLAKGFPAR